MKKPAIVSIEDDAELYRLIEFTLQPLSVAVYNAPNSHEAVALCREVEPEMIILDIRLPDLHGWDVLRTLREEAGLEVPHVIVLTTYSDPRHRLMGHFQDITAYLSKPFNPRELATLVAETLGLSHADQSAR